MKNIKSGILRHRHFYVLIFLIFSWSSCQKEAIPPINNPDDGIYRIPIVIHVIHAGEPVGMGYNLSEARIKKQIKLLNDDYRRKKGTRGFNTHPDGADSKIEFVLAKSTPDGLPTNGIVRIDATQIDNPLEPNGVFDFYAFYSYWNPEQYLNIWTLPFPETSIDFFLGMATGPETDLPGADLFLKGEPFQAEGVLINTAHFGESNINSDYNLGRTLTHEIGHYLGLLHPWGGKDCEHNDFCEDTPAVNFEVSNCSPGTTACDGAEIMVENYMNWTYDRCMNVFTNDQVARIHYVLENSPRRNSLLSSPGLKSPM